MRDKERVCNTDILYRNVCVLCVYLHTKVPSKAAFRAAFKVFVGGVLGGLLGGF